jgi:hypothetical protein
MKNFYFVLVFALAALISGCQDDITPMIDENSAVTNESEFRSLDEVVDLANNAATLLNDGSRSSRSRSISMPNAIIPVHRFASRSGDDQPDLYIVNYDNEQGYAIINAHVGQDAILGAVDNGSYSEDNDNPGLNHFLVMAADAAANGVLRVDTTSYGSYTTPDGPIFASEKILPKVSVKWGQHNPYGNLYSNGVSGCANTALAQVMSSFQYPDTLELTYSGAATSSIVLNWAEILKHKKSLSSDADDLTCCSSQIAHTQIPILLRELGCRNKSFIMTAGTGTEIEDVRATAIALGFKVSEFSTNFIIPEIESLLKTSIIYMVGWDATNGGHGWLIDGYYRYRSNGLGLAKYYDHINWGWDGNDNGYYDARVFDTSNPHLLDYGSSSSSKTHNYTIDLKYLTISR